MTRSSSAADPQPRSTTNQPDWSNPHLLLGPFQSLTSIVFAKHKHPHAIAVDCYNYIIEMVSKHAKSV
jgi:hypothetical protein